MVKKKGTIFIDNREKSEKVYHMFDSQNIFDVKIQALELGDIVCNGTYIERKTITDLLQSSKRDRFWLNLEDAKSNFKNYFLWIDASSEDIMREIEMGSRRGYRYSYSQYRGIKAAIMLMNIPIFEFAKIEDAAEFILILFKKMNSNKDDIPTGIKKSGVSIIKRRIDSISRIEGIGAATAKLLLEQHGTIENVITASKKKDTKIMRGIEEFFCQ